MAKVDPRKYITTNSTLTAGAISSIQSLSFISFKV